MDAGALRDRIVELATESKKVSASPRVDLWQDEIMALAALVPEAVAIVERRGGQDRRERDQPVTYFRRTSQRRRGSRFGAREDVIVSVVLVSASPADFGVASTTHQLLVEGRNYLGNVTEALGTILYESLDTGIVTVDSTGLVTAVAPGSTNVRAVVDGVALLAPYTVVSPTQTAVASVTITGPTSVREQQVISLTATVKDSGGNTLLGRTVTWAEVSGTGDVTLSADSGTDPHTVTVTGVTQGTRTVQATCETVNSAEYVLDVLPPPPPPGAYTAFLFQDWYNKPDTASIAGLIGTDEQYHLNYQPPLPVTDFYDIVTGENVPLPDGTMGPGSFLRFYGKTAFNSYPVIIEALNVGAAGNNINIKTMKGSDGNQSHRKWIFDDGVTQETYDNVYRANLTGALDGTEPGYTASTLVRVQGPMNTGIIALPGGPGVNAPIDQVNDQGNLSGGDATTKAWYRFADNAAGRTAAYAQSIPALLGSTADYLWVRMFIRFSGNWRTSGIDSSGGTGRAVGGVTGAESHKWCFLLEDPGGRGLFVADGPRGWQFGNMPGKGGAVLVSPTKIPGVDNVITFNEQYGGSSQPRPDLYSDVNDPGFFKLFHGPDIPNQQNAPFGDGNEEWYEFVWERHNGATDPGLAYEVQSFRQFTVGNVKAPRPWRHAALYKRTDGSAPFNRMVTFKWGINRNQQWIVDCHCDQSFIEVVDGNTYPNPFGMPYTVSGI